MVRRGPDISYIRKVIRKWFHKQRQLVMSRPHIVKKLLYENIVNVTL